MTLVQHGESQTGLARMEAAHIAEEIKKQRLPHTSALLSLALQAPGTLFCMRVGWRARHEIDDLNRDALLKSFVLPIRCAKARCCSCQAKMKWIAFRSRTRSGSEKGCVS